MMKKLWKAPCVVTLTEKELQRHIEAAAKSGGLPDICIVARMIKL